MSSNSFKNSSVSSSFGLERGLGKGITSDMGRTSLYKKAALNFLVPCNYCNSAASFFSWGRNPSQLIPIRFSNFHDADERLFEAG
jgi:hypothetical protein